LALFAAVDFAFSAYNSVTWNRCASVVCWC